MYFDFYKFLMFLELDVCSMPSISSAIRMQWMAMIQWNVGQPAIHSAEHYPNSGIHLVSDTDHHCIEDTMLLLSDYV